MRYELVAIIHGFAASSSYNNKTPPPPLHERIPKIRIKTILHTCVPPKAKVEFFFSHVKMPFLFLGCQTQNLAKMVESHAHMSGSVFFLCFATSKGDLGIYQNLERSLKPKLFYYFFATYSRLEGEMRTSTQTPSRISTFFFLGFALPPRGHW